MAFVTLQPRLWEIAPASISTSLHPINIIFFIPWYILFDDADEIGLDRTTDTLKTIESAQIVPNRPFLDISTRTGAVVVTGPFPCVFEFKALNCPESASLVKRMHRSLEITYEYAASSPSPQPQQTPSYIDRNRFASHH
jgi:hypothetical protein